MNKFSLILRFAYKPNIEGLCGVKTTSIYSLAEKNKLTFSEEESIKHFINTLHTVKQFTDALKNTPNAYEAYVIGYKNFKIFNKTAVPHLQENLKKAPLAKNYKLENMPKNIPWNHIAFVLYMGALYNKRIPIDNIDFLDKCKVSLGTVLEDNFVEYNKLEKGYNITNDKIKAEFPFFEAKSGQSVLLHHGVAFFQPNRRQNELYKQNLKVILKAAKNGWKYR